MCELFCSTARNMRLLLETYTSKKTLATLHVTHPRKRGVHIEDGGQDRHHRHTHPTIRQEQRRRSSQVPGCERKLNKVPSQNAPSTFSLGAHPGFRLAILRRSLFRFLQLHALPHVLRDQLVGTNGLGRENAKPLVASQTSARQAIDGNG